eukprot:g14690.t1
MGVREVKVIIPQHMLGMVQACLAEIDDIAQEPGIFQGEGCSLIMFKCQDKYCSRVVNDLSAIGVGVQYGTLDVVELQLTRPQLHSAHRSHRRHSRKNYRITVEEMRLTMNDSANVSFDFYALTACAAVIAGVGLICNSSVAVMASLLVSPFTSPLLALSFGLMTQDRRLWQKGVTGVVLGTLTSFLIGLFVGLFGAVLQPAPIADAFTDQMNLLGRPGNVAGWAVVTIPISLVVALSVQRRGGPHHMLHVALASTLLPPLVNGAVCLVYWLVDAYRPDSPFKKAGRNSLGLFAADFVLVLALFLLVFKLKKLGTRAVSERALGLGIVSPFEAAGVHNANALWGQSFYHKEAEEEVVPENGGFSYSVSVAPEHSPPYPRSHSESRGIDPTPFLSNGSDRGQGQGFIASLACPKSAGLLAADVIWRAANFATMFPTDKYDDSSTLISHRITILLIIAANYFFRKILPDTDETCNFICDIFLTICQLFLITFRLRLPSSRDFGWKFNKDKRVTPYLQSGEHLFHCTSPSSATALRSGLLLVPIAPQASLDLLCNPDWTDAEVTPDWSDNFAPLRMLICDYDPFEPPFDVFDSWNSYPDSVNTDTTLSPDICSHADTSNTDV